jgi:shikimate kinase
MMPRMSTSLVRRILITGTSGTGKSSVIERLAELGYPAIDADAPGYSMEIEVSQDELTGLGPGRDWVWRETAIRSALDRPDPILFLSGCSPNQGDFYPDLTHIIMLTAPPSLIRERLRTRTTNAFGQDPAELERALLLQTEIEPLLRRSATHVIDTSAPLDEVVAEVLRVSGIGYDPTEECRHSC